MYRSYDHKIRREIRDARAKDPLISVVALQDQLEKQFNRTFSRKYIAKPAFKVERQALQEADRTRFEDRLQFTLEKPPPDRRPGRAGLM